MVVICQEYCKKSQILAMCIKNMRKSRILRRKMHHKGDAKIGIKLKKIMKFAQMENDRTDN